MSITGVDDPTALSYGLHPVAILTKLFYGQDSGLKVLPGGGFVYISPGTGTWGPPIRVFAPPEITVIELKAMD